LPAFSPLSNASFSDEASSFLIDFPEDYKYQKNSLRVIGGDREIRRNMQELHGRQ